MAAREPFGDHDGRSGALLERAQLADGRHLIVKRFDPRHDLVMRITHDDVGREYALWRAGALDGFPPGVAHPIEAGWIEGSPSPTWRRP